MSQKEVEVILTRQLASYLTMPIFVVDPEGSLLFYNEPAESILGHRFEETGELPLADWATMFRPTDENGADLPSEQLPLVIALKRQRPSHGHFRIVGLDGKLRCLEVTAVPLIGQANRFLGALAIFWEMESQCG